MSATLSLPVPEVQQARAPSVQVHAGESSVKQRL